MIRNEGARLVASAGAPPTDGSQVHDAIELEGVISLLLGELAQPDSGGAHLFKLLTEAAGRIYSEGPLTVVWARGEQRGAFRLAHAGEAAAPLHELPELAPLVAVSEEEIPVTVTPYMSAHHVGLYVRVRTTLPPTDVWILTEGHSVNRNIFLDDSHVRNGFRAALLGAHALVRVGAARQRELSARVEAMCVSCPRDPQGRMQEAGAQIEALSREPPGHLDLVARLGRFILNEVLSAEAAGPENATDLVRPREEQELIRRVFSSLQEADAHWRDSWAESEALDRVRCLMGCFAALLPDQELPQWPIGNKAMRLLPSWVRECERWRHPLRRDERLWQDVVALTRPTLGRWLQQQVTHSQASPSPDRSLTSVRNILAICLCLNMAGAGTVGNQLRASLAYVMREALRFASFGDRADHVAVLRDMVAAHARGLLGSHCDVSGLLRAIGGERGINQSSAQGHLRHVLDVYMAGHHLLSHQLAGTGDQGASIAAALFGPGVEEQADGLRAFTLAALFHDFDVLFLGRRDSLGSRLTQTMGLDWVHDKELDLLRKDLDQLAGDPGAGGVHKRIAEDLKSGYTSTGEPLEEWLDEQGRGENLRHGTLSAWVLHCVCKDESGRRPDFLKKAVRAILLHEASWVEIDLAKDPVAGFLVLLNEIFTWYPEEAASGGVPAEPTDRWIALDRRALSWDEGRGAIHGTLTIEAGQPWPRVFIALQPWLPGPVWTFWLRKACNLGRLRPARPGGFSPVVEIISTIPCTLSQAGGDTLWLLREILVPQLDAPLASERLGAWLGALGPTRVRSDPGEEVVALGRWSNWQPWRMDLDRVIRRLMDLEDKKLREIAAEIPRPPPPGPDRRVLPPMEPPVPAPPSVPLVYICFAPEDAPYSQGLKTMLAVPVRERRLCFWDRGCLAAGADRQEEERRHLQAADLVVVLVSSALHAEDEAYTQLQDALDQGKRLLPVMVRDALPDGPLKGRKILLADRPVSHWERQDEAWAQVGQALLKSLAEPP